jgi:trans-aconitate methyltransferase
MDPETLQAYDRAPIDFSDEWHQQPAPVDLHALVKEFFAPGSTADIGCGSGRDTAWLKANGYDAVGYDPSSGLIAEARRRHPEVSFEEAGLPELHGVEDASLTNVLCETVIMHLGADLIVASVRRLLSILEPGGTLYLSWRVTEGTDQRDAHGRLYTAFDASLVTHALAPATILHETETTSASSGKTVRRVVARKAES